ncbi:MAG: hypothetical protein R2734_18935 [Nocardioides sp.]
MSLTDLVFSVRPAHPEAVGATALVLVGLACGLTDTVDVVALLAMAIVVMGWGHTVTRGFGRGPGWLPLALLAVAVAGVLALSPYAGEAGGLLGRYLDRTPLPVLAQLTPDRALLLAGVLLLQLSTGNVLVRLALAATGTVNPARRHRRDEQAPPGPPLKGGRLLGPMGRVFIVGLGLAGQVTAASIVVAAKGLLRFPELQAAREADRGGPGIHEVTEYFLVGSFLSWLLALGSLVLLV